MAKFGPPVSEKSGIILCSRTATLVSHIYFVYPCPPTTHTMKILALLALLPAATLAFAPVSQSRQSSSSLAARSITSQWTMMPDEPKPEVSTIFHVVVAVSDA